ncbi:hypothetical protein [Mycolicibacterium sp. CBMA 226]|uniref:hypothetical protein n=1 Tax=Mycolicibacterium sp. CBMA 226 TaxID=2606611 RepID=UPI0012DD0381|nr:hypothetical protein [Mycolicibacterium sp. CBMA 226]MUL75946.1 hypothetical protein [Mycolicibacterium sp. CBMA 226]
MNTRTATTVAGLLASAAMFAQAPVAAAYAPLTATQVGPNSVQLSWPVTYNDPKFVTEVNWSDSSGTIRGSLPPVPGDPGAAVIDQIPASGTYHIEVMACYQLSSGQHCAANAMGSVQVTVPIPGTMDGPDVGLPPSPHQAHCRPGICA